MRLALSGVLLLALAHAPVSAQMLEGIRNHDVVVRYTADQERLARAVLPQAIAPFPGLPPDILTRGQDVTVLLAPDEQSFTRWTGGLAPEWGAGVAFPALERIILPTYAPRTGSPADLRRTLRHELAHVALQRHLGTARVPRWFTEGYATWTAGQLDTEADWLLRVAFLTDRAPPLDSLELLWPEGATDARIAYLLSASAMRYLYAHGGEAPLTTMLERWRTGASLDDAMRTTYQMTLGRFERDWATSVRREYGWLRFFAQAAVLWSIVGVLIVVIWTIRRRYNRARLERMRAQEIPDTPAFWLENGDAPPAEPPRAAPPGTADASPEDRTGERGD